jgi:hypothetical protein
LQLAIGYYLKPLNQKENLACFSGQNFCREQTYSHDTSPPAMGNRYAAGGSVF